MLFRGPILILVSFCTLALAFTSDPIAAESLPSVVPAEPIKARGDTRSYAIRSAKGWRKRSTVKPGHREMKRRSGKGVRRLSADH